jgi:hypothetical protein
VLGGSVISLTVEDHEEVSIGQLARRNAFRHELFPCCTERR